MTVFESPGFSVQIRAEEPFKKISGGDFLHISSETEESIRELHVEASGIGRIIWPNREGEGFFIGEAFQVLKDAQALESGLNLAWPSTGAFSGCMFMDCSGEGVLVALPFDPLGRIINLRIQSRKPGIATFCLTGVFKEAWVLEFKSRKDLSGRISSFLRTTGRGKPRGRKPAGSGRKYQYQVGLIDPYGQTEVPEEKGFMVLDELAERFERIHHPEGDTLHVFGYGAGHDIGYPDYSPSSFLGGASGLAGAAEAVKRRGFELSLYMNARIVEREVVSGYSHLEGGFLRDDQGLPLEEVYQDRHFYIMDPGYEPWQDEIFKAAMKLKALGADWIQLDQVAGRQPAGNPGDDWGLGYEKMIRRIRAEGLKIWIQGVCDFYSADRFEMAYRDVSILSGGVIRGGNPFGEQDPFPAALFMGEREFLVPRDKSGKLAPGDFPNVVVDMLVKGEVLPLYGGSYLDGIERLEAEMISSGNQ